MYNIILVFIYEFIVEHSNQPKDQ